ncbi:MAG: hypothetical protein R3F48_02225 [Candidatus Zixiibacteriota bacterium]
MKRRIVIVSIFDLTRVFYKIAEALRAAGHDVFWITTQEIWTNWLKEQGERDEAILQLVYSPEKFLSVSEKASLMPQIVAAEANADLTVNQCMMMDQFIMQKNKPDINDYMYLYYRDIKAFLQRIDATDVIAEPTNSNELITFMLCRELGIRFISPRDMRYPTNRVLFFSSYLQNEIIPCGENETGVTGKELVDSFEIKKAPPYYFKKNSKMSALAPKKLASAARNRSTRQKIDSGNSLTHHDLSGRVRLAVKRTVNSRYMRHIYKYDHLEDIKCGIAYFGLHVQPESSIDVLGSYFSHQLKLIQDIRRALPFDTTLVVKEHPNFLGIKSLSFFDELRRIPNLALVKHDVSSFDIYERASIIFTVSGTPAYEAGLLGLPAVMFAPMFFGGLSSVRFCSDLTMLRGQVYHLLTDFSRDYEADCAFMESLIAKSHPGFWSDPVNYPHVLEDDNVTKLQTAFVKAIEYVDR